LIEGASEDRGGGRALLGVLRTVDAIVFCARAGSASHELEVVCREVAAAGIEKPSLIALTRADEADGTDPEPLGGAGSELPILRVSILDDASLEALRAGIWQLTGLIRVRLRVNGETADEPLAMRPPVTVEAVADAVHHDLAAAFVGARIWGASARFDGQRVGRDHIVADDDVVEILR
jgi:ribosome-interacting GTPase 1